MLLSCLLQKQVLTGSLNNGCSKDLFRKVPGKSASLLQKDSTLDVLLGSMQKFLEKLFLQNTSGWMLPKIQIAFF